MKKLNKKLCSLFIAASSTLLPYTSVHAEKSPWECKPSPDFSSWICLKDGKAPVEEVPETVAEQPADTEQPPDVTVTPLAPPETIQPAEVAVEEAEPQPEAEPSVAPIQAVSDEAVADTAIEPTPVPTTEELAADETETGPAQPVTAEQTAAEVADIPPPAPQVDEAATPEAEAVQPVEPPVVAEQAEPSPPEEAEAIADTTTQPEATPEIPGPDTAPVDAQDIPAEKLVDRYAPIEGDFVKVDESLRSCIALNQVLDIDSEERQRMRETSPTEIEADEAEIEKDKQSVLTGNVRISRADQTLYSDRVVLNKQANQADAAGRVKYTDSQVQIKAEQAHLDFNTDENTFAETSFITFDRYSRGAAGQIQTQQGTRVDLDNVTYTTCPPGINSWQIEADEITLDDETGRGEAKGAKLRVFDVPIAFLPYMSFPIDDRRKTGFLTPRIGNSDSRGFEVTTPYYWNIAPDRDATFYPRYMHDRGLQLGGEYRYLNEKNHGQINMEYLADDDEYEGRGDSDRWGVKFEHDATLFDRLSLSTRYRRVSDDQYFEDLGSSMSLTSTTHLHSYLNTSTGGNNWSASGQLHAYQTVDSTIADVDEPYKLLPRLNFEYWTDPFAERFTANIKTAYTDFDHRSSAKVTGSRTSFYPSVTYNYDKAGYYIRPKLGVHYTTYSLDNQGALPSSPDRTVPIFSVDSGLFYEKESSLLGKSMLQTLEPRIYYLYVDEEKQDDIPNFDSGIFDFGTSALFRENRFSGGDRIGDANQVSVAVTSRFLDTNDGSEKLSATLGQIYYFDDRDVTLPGDAPDTDDVSPIIAELRYQPYRELAASAMLHWDPEENNTDRTVYSLKYQPEDDKIINLAYRYRDSLTTQDSVALEQTDLSFLWPLGKQKRWHLLGKWNYSLKDDKTLDTFGGIEYESCCWKTRFVARRWVQSVDSEFDTGVFFEIEFKGLGSVGDDVTGFLETGILGYDRYISEDDDDTYYY